MIITMRTSFLPRIPPIQRRCPIFSQIPNPHLRFVFSHRANTPAVHTFMCIFTPVPDTQNLDLPSPFEWCNNSITGGGVGLDRNIKLGV